MCEISLVYALDGRLGHVGADEAARMMAAGAEMNSHGWGMFSDDNHVVKKPAKFVMTAERDQILADYADKTFVVGHVRFATHGKHIPECTHPLVFKNWTLVHNGVIQNERELRAKYSIPKTPAVDSFIIVWLINHHYHNNGKDVEKAVKLTTAELKGWYSCFLFDQSEKRLFYFRNGAEFYLRLVVTDDGQHFIVGNTKKDTASVAFSKGAWGFRISAARTMGWVHPREDALYEIAETGVSVLCDLPPPVEEPAELVQSQLAGWARKGDWADQYDNMDGKPNPCAKTDNE